MAGLIDGDGHIQVDKENSVVSIRIKVHPNWTESFKLLSAGFKELYEIDSDVRLTKGGWVYLSIGKMRHVVRLYDLVRKQVPIMDRKWAALDEVKTHCLNSDDGRLGKIGVNPSANLLE